MINYGKKILLYSIPLLYHRNENIFFIYIIKWFQFMSYDHSSK